MVSLRMVSVDLLARLTIEAGDAFYMPPGHAPEAEEGTEIVQFSRAEELAAMVAALKASMQPED